VTFILAAGASPRNHAAVYYKLPGREGRPDGRAGKNLPLALESGACVGRVSLLIRRLSNYRRPTFTRSSRELRTILIDGVEFNFWSN
jgi:hypothetical protein